MPDNPNRPAGLTEPLCKDGFLPDLTRIGFWVFGLWVGSLVLDAPFRYGLSLLHLDLFVYLPKMLLAGFLALVLLKSREAVTARMVGGFLLAYLAWGVVNLADYRQALFGLWVLVPFLFGLWMGRYAAIPRWRHLIIWLFILTAGGVFLDFLFALPWGGKYGDVLGYKILVSRQWDSFSMERCAGFARASFDAASQLLVFGILLVVSPGRRWTRVLVWLCAGVGIALTTSKGALGAWLLLTIYFMGGGLLRWPRCWARLWEGALAGILLGMIVLPLSVLWFHYDPAFFGRTMKFLFLSFTERLTWMWPDSWRLLDLGGGYHWWTGRGWGGLGAAQAYFEPALYRAGDNAFVYAAVLLGLPAAFLGIAAFGVTLWRRLRHGAPDWLLSLVLAIISYGVVMNIFEEPLLAYALGLSLTCDGKRDTSV
jgi:hypothetical protein